MIQTLSTYEVGRAIKYAKAAKARRTVIQRASDYDCGRDAPLPGDIGKLVMDALFAGIDCMVASGGGKAIFKPVKEN